MNGRYDQSELNIYGAEDDDEMDAIYRAMDTWEQRETHRDPTPADPERDPGPRMHQAEL